MKALITGGAGFIGSHVTDRFLGEGWSVTVVDNFDDYYDPDIKQGNIDHYLRNPAFRLVAVDIRDYDRLLTRGFDRYDLIVHLAAKPGVRASMKQPAAYYDVNLRGTLNVLRFARQCGASHFIFASSSSVYGENPALPWNEDAAEPAPISPYAGSKLAAEILGRQFAARCGIPFTVLRLFTVYGPRQRPDLAIHKFAASMLRGDAITLYGDGTSLRDYTFIDDVVDGIWAIQRYGRSAQGVFNLGTGEPISILQVVRELERALGIEAGIRWESEQPGDLKSTLADVSRAGRVLGYRARVAFSEGLSLFVDHLKRQIGLTRGRSQPIGLPSFASRP